MALYNEILSGRFNRAIQKYLGIKGGPPAAQLASDIAFTWEFPLGNEFRILESWAIFMTTANMTAPGVGNRVGFRLRNPAASNVVTVLQKVTYANIVGTVDGPFATFQTIATDLNVAAGAPRSLDKRFIGNSAMIRSQQNNAA